MKIEPEVWKGMTLALGCLFTALVLAVMHWVPRPARLSRISAYVWGVFVIVLGFTAWRMLNGDWETPVGLLLICGVGGGTVVGAYKVDGIVAAIRRASMAEAVDAELGSRVEGTGLVEGAVAGGPAGAVGAGRRSPARDSLPCVARR